MEIKVLGTGCSKCRKLYKVTEEAIAEAGVEAKLTKVERIDRIAAYGIAFLPGLVINEEVRSAGRLPKAAQIVAWIREAAGRE